MSITAAWQVYDGRPGSGETRVADTPADVDSLVVALSRGTSGVARIEHDTRPHRPHPFTGEPAADHLVMACVGDDFCYLYHVDPDHDPGHPVGDPASPVYHSDSEEFPAGSGIPVETLATALKEFLATGQRPTCVDWTPAYP